MANCVRNLFSLNTMYLLKLDYINGAQIPILLPLSFMNPNNTTYQKKNKMNPNNTLLLLPQDLSFKIFLQ